MNLKRFLQNTFVSGLCTLALGCGSNTRDDVTTIHYAGVSKGHKVDIDVDYHTKTRPSKSLSATIWSENSLMCGVHSGDTNTTWESIYGHMTNDIGSGKFDKIAVVPRRGVRYRDVSPSELAGFSEILLQAIKDAGTRTNKVKETSFTLQE
jgi:hypothetical protein